jgi:hypothetical protein
VVDVPGEGRGEVGVQVEHVPIRVHPEDRRIEPRVPAFSCRKVPSAQPAKDVEIAKRKSERDTRTRGGRAASRGGWRSRGVGGGWRLRVRHREHVVEVLAPQRLHPPPVTTRSAQLSSPPLRARITQGGGEARRDHETVENARNSCD